MTRWIRVDYPEGDGPIDNSTANNSKIDEAMNISGVYLLYLKKNGRNFPRYIGRAKNIRNRMHAYERFEAHTSELRNWLKGNLYSGKAAVKYTAITTEAERERMECHLIKHYNKSYHIINKNIPFVCSGRLDFELPI